MRALDRKLFRDLWHMRGQVLAVALVIGSGLSVFIMTLGAVRSLEETMDAYYERYRFADVFAGLKRAPDWLGARIADIPGVQTVETRVVQDVVLDVAGLEEPARGRLVSVPRNGFPKLNGLVIREGRTVDPSRPDEVVVNENFAEAHGFQPGATVQAIINGKKRRLRIVGIGLSPEYVYSLAPGALLPDDLRYGVFWMGRDALAAAYDLEGAFNSVSLTLLRNVSPQSVIDRLDTLLKPYGGAGAYPRHDQISHWFLRGEIDQLRLLAGVLPVIFLAVAAFLLNMVVSRLVATEREQIGLMKAFGYGDFAVGWHYFKMVLVMALLGLVLGYAGGAVLGRLMTEMYAQFFRFPFLYYRPDPGVYGLAAVASLAAAIVGTVTAVRAAVLLPPAQAMVPPPPARYRRGLLSRLGLNHVFDQPTLMIFRHVIRWPLRSFMTVLGISFALAVLFTSLQWFDSIEYLLEAEFYDAQRQTASVTFVEPRPLTVMDEFRHLPGVLAVEPFRLVPARFRFGHRMLRQGVFGVSPKADLSLVRDAGKGLVIVPEEGVVLSKKLAELIGAGRGDRVTIEILAGRRPVVSVPVVAVYETYFGTPAYMSLGALDRIMMEGNVISGVHLAVDGTREADFYRSLKQTPVVAAVSVRRAAIGSFRKTLAETMNMIVYFYVGFAILMTLGVVYNSARISLSERGRELASLRVMGFTRGETSYILLGELALLTLIALPLGSVFGYGLARFIAGAMENELYRVPFAPVLSTYGFSVLAVVLAALLSGLLVRRRIDRLDLIAVLKMRE